MSVQIVGSSPAFRGPLPVSVLSLPTRCHGSGEKALWDRVEMQFFAGLPGWQERLGSLRCDDARESRRFTLQQLPTVFVVFIGKINGFDLRMCSHEGSWRCAKARVVGWQ